MSLSDIIKVIIFGIVEGITEWLPISSTGHLILIENLLRLDQPEDFWIIFKVVIQLGAILSVVVIFWDRLWPFSPKKTPGQKHYTWALWARIVVATVPAVIIGFFLDDYLDAHLSTPLIIGLTLIFYGLVFIVIENRHDKRYRFSKVNQMDILTVAGIGLFQCLSFIPGTSRSGATIIGGMLLGCTRPAAAQFSFYLGIPVMFGAVFLKTVKHGLSFTGAQWGYLFIGTLVSFLVSMLAVRKMMSYVKKHSFAVFGIYRIILGIIVLVWFCVLG